MPLMPLHSDKIVPNMIQQLNSILAKPKDFPQIPTVELPGGPLGIPLGRSRLSRLHKHCFPLKVAFLCPKTVLQTFFLSKETKRHYYLQKGSRPTDRGLK